MVTMATGFSVKIGMHDFAGGLAEKLSTCFLLFCLSSFTEVLLSAIMLFLFNPLQNLLSKRSCEELFTFFQIL